MARHDYWPRYGLENYTLLLPFEDSFDGVKSTGWMQVKRIEKMNDSFKENSLNSMINLSSNLISHCFLL